MNCQEFTELNAIEKKDFIGALVHVVMSDSNLFMEGQLLIKKGEKLGLFTGVTFNPPTEAPEINNINQQ